MEDAAASPFLLKITPFHKHDESLFGSHLRTGCTFNYRGQVASAVAY